MKRIIAVGIITMAIMATTRVGAEQTTTPDGSQAGLSRAAAANKFLFVFVTENNTDATQATRKTFETALAKLADQTEWIAVDRTDAGENGPCSGRLYGYACYGDQRISFSGCS